MNSLTHRMEQDSGAPVTVERHQIGYAPANKLEKNWLHLRQREWGFVREVVLHGINTHKTDANKKPWVLARTFIPQNTLCGSAKRLRLLNDKPLGPFLFNNLAATRTHLEVHQHQRLTKEKKTHSLLWHRYSLFSLAQGMLIVSEIFLPDCPIYHDANH